VAHNFNNLLQIIMGGAQLASVNLELANMPNVKRHLEQILENSQFGQLSNGSRALPTCTQSPCPRTNMFDLSDLSDKPSK
jgi:hypothetical protein